MTGAASEFDPACPAQQLNLRCTCQRLDWQALQRRLEADSALAGLAAALAVSHPHLFSSLAVYVSAADIARMQAYIAAVETVVALPAYQARVLAQAPALARHVPAAQGVFFGFDFHLTEFGPQLIEINTNAGGALLNLALARAQQACAADCAGAVCPPAGLATLEDDFVAMFRAEWQAAAGEVPLRRIAIVDETPAEQFLAPEFRLFQQLFLRHGIEAVIAPPEALRWDGECLSVEDAPIDLVYNRLTDFYLESPASAALRAAYLADRVVLTPHPRAHALYADKANLCLFGDAAALAELGAAPQTIATLLAGTPATRAVDESLWSERRQWFFKPRAGYGSKATYRGDKLTRRVWQEILQGDYIAQRLVPPSERLQLTETGERRLKLDLRAYSYRGQVQLFAARLYQGQTTNLRTPGGGFAPVFMR